MLNLTREQGEAVGLLSIGTMLEYFDLLLYVHMAILLNDLFFPKTDAHTASLLAAFAFCSTYVFRPVGALIFGYIGDHFGRKSTVIITTLMMAASCFAMAILPTYAEIGYTASVVMIICRMLQGMSAMSETVGAELYLTESISAPAQYPVVALTSVFSALGGMLALAVASIAISASLNWRYAFWVGSGIAMIGAVARTRLRETPEFIDAKRRIKNTFERANVDSTKLKNNPILQDKVNKLTLLALFFIQCAGPVCFYFVYIYSGTILKDSFGYTPEQIINQSFIVSIVHVVSYLILAFLSYYVYPLRILKVKAAIFCAFILVYPYLLDHVTSGFQILLMQSFIVLFRFGDTPAMPIFYKHFPVFKRFTMPSLSYALSRACTYIITSFGLIYLIEYFGNIGLLVIMIPVAIGFILGLLYFEKLEKITGNVPTSNSTNKQNQDVLVESLVGS